MKTIEIKDDQAVLVFDNDGGATIICSEKHNRENILDLSSTTVLLLSYLLQQKDLCDELYSRAMEEANMMDDKFKNMVN